MEDDLICKLFEADSLDMDIVLERAHISSNSSFIELENVEFEHMTSVKENEFFEFKLEFRDEFAVFWLELFERFKFDRVRVSQKYKPSNSNFIEFEI